MNNQKGFTNIILIGVIVAIVAVGGFLYTKSQLNETGKVKILVSVLDASTNQPVSNAVIELGGLAVGIPEDPTPQPTFGKEKTKNGVALFYISANSLDEIFAFDANVTADNYLAAYETFNTELREFTIQLVNKQTSLASSQAQALDYAKKNEWVAYWLEKHPEFNPNDQKNYLVTFTSPYWWVIFRDSGLKHPIAKCNEGAWDPTDIRCTIAAKINAVDGTLMELKPDLADTGWAPSYGF
ncbi:MAG: hypothetical protein WC052_01590 [Patescibacteria group bacterium]